jgi:hypothetical protein
MYFRRHGAEETIRAILVKRKLIRGWDSQTEYDEIILAVSRRALISLEENELNSIGKEALWPMDQVCPTCAMSELGERKATKWRERCELILKYLGYAGNLLRVNHAHKDPSRIDTNPYHSSRSGT